MTLHDNPLRTRADLVAVLFALCDPAAAHLSTGRARLRIGASGCASSPTVQEMEGFCRLLWGLAPYAAAAPGQHPALMERFCEGLANGTDPGHPEFWGAPADHDQRFVESAAIACALLLAPAAFWGPLTLRQRANLVAFLGCINAREVRDNNWLLFRVLVNGALRSVDAPHSQARVSEDLARVDSFYGGDGWYRDGPHGACDYYCAFAFHFYALLHATLVRAIDAEQAARARERAGRFAAQFTHWFSTDGSAIPYGRSLTYRCAQGAFWGALALAGGGSMSAGAIKGMLLRHLRWWLRRPIVCDRGLLTVGYGYENALVADQYTSPCSPYWALKALLPLALHDDHDFWRSTEEPLAAADGASVQAVPGVLAVRHGTHVYSLVAARTVPRQHRHASEKYAKFAYSTLFGFSVPTGSVGEATGACDSALALTTDGARFRARTHSEWAECGAAGIVARWRPWHDVEVTTWLVPASAWHVRVHLIRTSHPVGALEGGFSCEWRDEDPMPDSGAEPAAHGLGVAISRSQLSVIVDLCGNRAATLTETQPNTNVLHPRCVLPLLESRHGPGEHWLACAVAGACRDEAELSALLAQRPSVRADAAELAIYTAAGVRLFADSVSRVDAAVFDARPPS